MSDNKEILQAINELKSQGSELNSQISELKTQVGELKSETQLGFKMVNKRLDGIENELRKIDTVLSYSEQYNNIPT